MSGLLQTLPLPATHKLLRIENFAETGGGFLIGSQAPVGGTKQPFMVALMGGGVCKRVGGGELRKRNV